MQMAFLQTENHLTMCSEAAQEPSPNVLRSLMLYNFTEIGGFWFWFLLFPTQLYTRNSFSCLQKEFTKAAEESHKGRCSGKRHNC